ncbi:MAG: hypothetical protein NC820_08350, partial [Candidatus Omnitrophica bacterium]|nr:hypothetical protein [Candidatus Omnitrophota bacterium]
MNLQNFEIVLKEVKKRLIDFKDEYYKNERAICTQIIEPLLSALDWDIYNPKEVGFEKGTEEGIPDYTLKKNDKVFLYIEVKNLSKDIESQLTQIGKYCYGEGVMYAAITNGINWLLFKSFEEGKSIRERVIWKINIQEDSEERIFKRLQTISKEGIDNLDILLEKEKLLEQTWNDIFISSDSNLIKAMLGVIKNKLISGKQIEELMPSDEEVEEFVRMKLKENFFGQQPVIEEPPITISGERKGIKIKGEFIPIDSSFEILTQTAEYLIRQKKLTKDKVPIKAGPRRYLINSKPEHRNNNRMRAPKRLSNGLYIETHYSTNRCIEY